LVLFLSTGRGTDRAARPAGGFDVRRYQIPKSKIEVSPGETGEGMSYDQEEGVCIQEKGYGALSAGGGNQ